MSTRGASLLRHDPHRFPITTLRALRTRARNAAKITLPNTGGWTVSLSDPARVVQVFSPTLALRPGHRLRAYQYTWGGNGNGIVHALPNGAPFDPPRFPDGAGEHSLSHPPLRPDAALDHFMDAIDGDGTPWSFLCASLLFRELSEFGAVWHGESWSMHAPIASAPWLERGDAWDAGASEDEDETLSTSPDEWTGEPPSGDEWQPTVRIDDRGAEAIFYTFTALGGARVLRHVNRYAPGSLRPETSSDVVMQGPFGMVV